MTYFFILQCAFKILGVKKIKKNLKKLFGKKMFKIQ